MKKTSSKRPKPKSSTDPSLYPKGSDRKRAEALIDHYENQTDDEAIAEAEAAYAAVKTTMMRVPIELVPKVQQLIAKRAG